MKSFLKCALAGAIIAGCTLELIEAVQAASSTIQITGTVSVICKINGNAQQTLSGPQTDLGSITEFCNSPGGYQVWVDYAPGIGGQTLYVDGRAVPLSDSGSTMIDSSANAAVQNRSLTLTGTGALTSLSMRIVPL